MLCKNTKKYFSIYKRKTTFKNIQSLDICIIKCKLKLLLIFWLVPLFYCLCLFLFNLEFLFLQVNLKFINKTLLNKITGTDINNSEVLELQRNLQC